MGLWSWISGSNQADSGLAGNSGRFSACEWTEAEKRANPCRRGFIRPAKNSHAFELADGTPFLLLGDTWWSTPTYRYRWYDDERERPLGPHMGFKDMVRFRKLQGFNCIAILAAFPTWANDGRPAEIVLDDGRQTCLRSDDTALTFLGYQGSRAWLDQIPKAWRWHENTRYRLQQRRFQEITE